jgi:5'-methylthioadenosine phosphorylase
MQAEIGIIGGTGLYDPKFLTKAKEIKMRTPYGLPSDSITIGEL